MDRIAMLDRGLKSFMPNFLTVLNLIDKSFTKAFFAGKCGLGFEPVYPKRLQLW